MNNGTLSTKVYYYRQGRMNKQVMVV